MTPHGVPHAARGRGGGSTPAPPTGANATDPCGSRPAATAPTTNTCPDSSAGPATSFTNNDDVATPNERPPGTNTLSGPGTGGSFTSLTTIDTVTGTDDACPSETVN